MLRAPEVPPPLVGPMPSSVHITRARQGGSLEALPRGTGVIWVTWGAAPRPWRLPASSPPWGLGHRAWKRAEEMKWKETGWPAPQAGPSAHPAWLPPRSPATKWGCWGQDGPSGQASVTPLPLSPLLQRGKFHRAWATPPCSAYFWGDTQVSPRGCHGPIRVLVGFNLAGHSPAGRLHSGDLTPHSRCPEGSPSVPLSAAGTSPFLACPVP